jgi:lipopolysaccharide biosynthesis glycosyltransferase
VDDVLQVACGVEGERHVHHCAVMLHSLFSSNPGESIRIHYLHGTDTSVRGRTRLNRMVDRLGGEVWFQEVPDNWVEGLPTTDFTRKATWYRILLDELLPDVDRVLWLDVDLIVMRPLRLLWERSLTEHVVGAVSNVPPGPDRSYTERPELGGDPYFNAGVLLFDLDALRGAGLGSTLRSYARTHADRMRWRDQDVLNEVLHAMRFPLEPRWNCMNSILAFDYAAEYFDAADLAEARIAPAIRHFEGPGENKPWHLLADREGRRRYRLHRLRTPWPLHWPDGATPRNFARLARRGLV